MIAHRLRLHPHGIGRRRALRATLARRPRRDDRLRGRLRSGWRFALFLAAFVFAGSVLNTLLVSAFVSAGYDLGEGSPEFLAAGSFVSLVLALAVGYYCGKYLEGLPFSALGASPLRGWFRNLSIGLLLGLITLGIAVGIGVAAGGISFQMNTAVPTSAILSSLATAAIVFALAAAFEEALFRGYILQTFARSGLAWFAILLTSAFFASVHLMNPGAGEISTVNTALAGIWFGGWAAERTGSDTLLWTVDIALALGAAVLAWLAVEKIKTGHVTGVGAARELRGTLLSLHSS